MQWEQETHNIKQFLKNINRFFTLEPPQNRPMQRHSHTNVDMKYEFAEWRMNKRWQLWRRDGTCAVRRYSSQAVAGISSLSRYFYGGEVSERGRSWLPPPPVYLQSLALLLWVRLAVRWICCMSRWSERSQNAWGQVVEALFTFWKRCYYNYIWIQPL